MRKLSKCSSFTAQSNGGHVAVAAACMRHNVVPMLIAQTQPALLICVPPAAAGQSTVQLLNQCWPNLTQREQQHN
jgi:hypothetical protein